MADPVKRPRSLKDLVEESRFWDASDLLRNFDEEMERMQLGFGHLAWDSLDRPLSLCMRPLPTVPRFEISENKDEFSLRVSLPNVPPENVRVDVDRRSVEVLACSDDLVCKPYYVSVESRIALDQDSAEAGWDGHWLEIRVRKAIKHKVEVRQR